MKYLTILVFLTGCTVDVQQWEINKAIEYCGSSSSIQSITSSNFYKSRAYCTNGKSKTMELEYE